MRKFRGFRHERSNVYVPLLFIGGFAWHDLVQQNLCLTLQNAHIT